MQLLLEAIRNPVGINHKFQLINATIIYSKKKSSWCKSKVAVEINSTANISLKGHKNHTSNELDH